MSRTRFTVCLALVILTPAPAADPVARTDLAGDPLPPGAVARLGTTRFRAYGYGSGSAVLFPDGSRAAWMDSKGMLTQWDVATGKAVGRTQVPDLNSQMARSAVSPKGDRLAILGVNRDNKLTLRVIDLKETKSVWTTRFADADRARPLGVVFTPDGKRLLAAGEDVRVFDVKTGDELRRQAFTGGINEFALSPDGKTVAAGRADLWLWDWETDTAPRKVERGDTARIEVFLFSPDGKQIYVGGRNPSQLQRYDVASGRAGEKFDLGGWPRWVSPSPDGKTIAVAYASSGDETWQSSTIVLKDWTTGKDRGRVHTGTDHPPNHGSYYLTRPMWSSDGSRILSRNNHRLWVWDVATGKQLGPTVPGHEGWIAALAFASDGRLYSAGDDPIVRAWDPATGKLLDSLTTTGSLVLGLTVSRDGSLVAASALADDVRVWDTRTGKQLFKLQGHGRLGGVRNLQFSADDQTLVSYGDDDFVRRWDTLTGKLSGEHRIRSADSDYLHRGVVALGLDGKVVVLGTPTGIVVHSTETGKERYRLEAAEALCVSPDGKRLATIVATRREGIESSSVVVWNLEDAKEVARFAISQYAGRLSMTFTPDGGTLVTASATEDAVEFWDVNAGKRAGTIDLPYRGEALAFDPTGNRLAVGFLDTTILVYDVSAALKRAKKE